RIKGNITSSKPATLHDAINMARELVEFRVGLPELVKAIKGNGKTTKETPTTITITTTITTTTTTATETTTITNNKTGGRKLPGPMLQPQLRAGVMLEICQSATVATLTTIGNPLQSDKELVIGRKIVELGFQLQENQQNEGTRARAYVVVENPQQNPNVVTGTFLLNDHSACILFDSGAEKSFVSSAFTPFIDIAPTALNTSYEVELADGKVVSTNAVLRSCTLVLLNHVFKIDLLPTRLGSFDVIIGMDWLSYHRAVIDCYEKIVRIPLSNGKILKVQGERPEKDPGSLACIKADEKKLDDIRVVRDFPEGEASKDLKALAEWLRGLETHFERRDDGGIYFFDHFWIPSVSRYVLRALRLKLNVRNPQDYFSNQKSLSGIKGEDNNYYKTEKLARIYINEIVARHGVSVSIICRDMMYVRVHIYGKALQKAFRKEAWTPRYVGPFEIVQRVGKVAYRLKLPQELSCVHDMFHVSNHKKCLAEPDVQVPLDEIETDENLRFVDRASLRIV
ncbi:putative reverse transcriptase domain-containing protein, partial [Tanacetum coccineum]